MMARDLEGGWKGATPPVGYALLGSFALALSLAGVLGGHALVEEVFGVPEEEQAVASDRESDGECPSHLRAADACDYDTDTSVPREDNEGCGTDHNGGAVSAHPVRHAAADGAAPATLETFTEGR